jgi:hydroxymethylpyrimidine/phosphomethylpyrimidine kinase
MRQTVLTIGTFDPTGYEGLVVDLRVWHTYRAYGLGVATAILAHNTQAVLGVYPVPLEHVGAQLEAVFNDVKVLGVKVGAVPDLKTAELVAGVLQDVNVPIVVVDPVLRSATGYAFHRAGDLQSWTRLLGPIATVLTPNVEEAAVLSDMETVSDVTAMKAACEIIHHRYRPAHVIVKGGRLPGLAQATDVLYDGRRHHVLEHPWTRSPNRLGAGDAFAAVVTALLVQGNSLTQAVTTAKQFIARSMQHTFQIAQGPVQPLNLTIPRM